MPKSIYNKIIHDIGFAGLAEIASSFAGILLIPFFTKIAGVYNYGLYIEFTVTITLVMSFATLGLPYATVRFLAGENEKDRIRDDFYSSLILISIASCVVSLMLLASSDLVARLIFGNLVILVKLLAMILPIDCLLFSVTNVFRVFQEIRKFALISIIKTYVEIITILLIVSKGYGIVEIAFSLLVIRIILLLSISIIVVMMIGIRFPRFSRMKDYLKFGLPTIPGNMAVWTANSSDRYLIGLLLGTVFVGYYNPAYSLGSLIIMIMSPINFVLVAVLAKYYEEREIDIVRNLFNYSIKYFLVFATPAVFGLSILSKPILVLLSTTEIANQSYLVTPLIAIGTLLYGVGGGIINFSLYLNKKTNITMFNWVCVAFINFLLNIILIPMMGIVGAAISFIASFLIGFILCVHFSFKYFDFYIDYGSILKILIAAICMSLIIINIHPTTLYGIVFTVILGCLAYFTFLISLGFMRKEEMDFLKSFLMGVRSV